MGIARAEPTPNTPVQDAGDGAGGDHDAVVRASTEVPSRRHQIERSKTKFSSVR